MSQNPCPECQDSILNNLSSIIANPICVDSCPTDIGCQDVIQTGCISYNGATLGCLNVVPGTSLNSILLYLESLCQASIGANNFLVKTTVTDTCGGYLSSKLLSSTLNINTINPSGCSNLKIEEKSWTTNSISLLNQWVAGNTYAFSSYTAPYWSIKNDKVQLKGQIIYNGTANITVAFILPASARPSQKMVFTYVAMIPKIASLPPNPLNIWNVFITIETDGKFTVIINPVNVNTTTGTLISLDFISYTK